MLSRKLSIPSQSIGIIYLCIVTWSFTSALLCSEETTFGTDSCGQCQCISGFGGQDCTTDVSTLGCSLEEINPTHTSESQLLKISKGPKFTQGGRLVISLNHTSLAKKNHRKTFIGFGSDNYSHPVCSCWTHEVSSSDEGICRDEYILDNKWELLLPCCPLDTSNPDYYSYNCNIFVRHMDVIAVDGWRGIPIRETKETIPLKLRIQRRLKLGNDVIVISNSNVIGGLITNQYNNNNGESLVELKTMVVAPYKLQVTSIHIDSSQDLQVFNNPQFENINCPQTGTCEQKLRVQSRLTSPTPSCYSATYNIYFSVECNTFPCTKAQNSQSNQIIARLAADCSKPEETKGAIRGDLEVTNSKFEGGYKSFTIYRPPALPDSEKACIKFFVAYADKAIKQTYFKSLLLRDAHGTSITLYNEADGICPEFSSDICGPNGANVLVDTEDQSVFMPVQPNEAKACFILTKGYNTKHGNRGLIDDLWLPFLPGSLEVEATLGASFDPESSTEGGVVKTSVTLTTNLDINDEQMLQSGVGVHTGFSLIVCFIIGVVLWLF